MTDRNGRVKGKVALVTGGASGIGAACAKMLAREGAAIVITDLDKAMAAQVVDEIRTAGGDAFALYHDVVDEPGWQEVMDEIMRRHGRLNIAVNCAGTSVKQRAFPADAPLDEWQHVIAVNLDGVFLGTKHALKAMMASNPVNGSIINISSILGIVGSPGIGAYNASKGGVRSYTKSVALSCAEDRVNVRVNSVHPGYIYTPLFQKALERSGDAVAALARYESIQPVGHLGEPDDIAYGVLYLASDESKFMTGAELVIDGGYTAR